MPISLVVGTIAAATAARMAATVAQPLIVVVMGVAGSGKTTVGTLLAEALGCPFLDGDSLHPVENITAMREGVPLTDISRGPWLATIRARLVDAAEHGRCLVVACSALKESYRHFLEEGVPITWVYLKGHEDLIRTRLEQRTGHFMAPQMLASQLDVLEEPAGAIVVDVTLPPPDVVDRILSELS